MNKYRVKEVVNKTGDTRYIPQVRVGLFKWAALTKMGGGYITREEATDHIARVNNAS